MTILILSQSTCMMGNLSNLLRRNRPREISACLDLTREDAATVTDVIGCERCTSAQTLRAVDFGHQRLKQRRCTSAPNPKADQLEEGKVHKPVNANAFGFKLEHVTSHL